MVVLYYVPIAPMDFRCVAVCCSVLQCVAVCCSVLQCVAVCCHYGGAIPWGCYGQ